MPKSILATVMLVVLCAPRLAGEHRQIQPITDAQIPRSQRSLTSFWPYVLIPPCEKPSEDARVFDSYTPGEHYRLAMCYGYVDNSGRSPDVDLSIRHLEAIRKGDDYYSDASRLLPMLLVERDKPLNEFHATLRDYHQKCIDRIDAYMKVYKAQRPCPGLNFAEWGLHHRMVRKRDSKRVLAAGISMEHERCGEG